MIGEDYKTPCLFRMTDAKNEWAAKKIYAICRDAEKNSTEINEQRIMCMEKAAYMQSSYAAKEYYPWCLENL